MDPQHPGEMCGRGNIMIHGKKIGSCLKSSIGCGCGGAGDHTTPPQDGCSEAV